MNRASTNRSRVPELLAPAGDWDCARAAVANGADAIYFGLDCGFNARARATNFQLDDLPRLMEFLHGHGVAGYVTVNILAFSAELPGLETAVRRIAEAGADAVLVQDLGLVHLIRQVAPELAIHASTQMTLTCSASLNVVQRLGVERVVLPRELSVAEIARIHRETSLDLEVFVHGALCIAYSGQCLTSESLGGRSANRGQCAQACRLPYELVCDGQDVDLGDRKYLLSPQDLAAYALIPDLIEVGAAGFKIEGRLKTPEYVANITGHYRLAIDAAMAGRPVEFTARQVTEMELSFSRGFSVGWLQGSDHKALVPATSSAKRGVPIGTVHDVRQGRVRVQLSGFIKAGDGLAFAGDRTRGEDQGARIHAVYRRGRRVRDEVADGLVEVVFHGTSLDLDRIHPGQAVWKSDDPALTRRLRRSYRGEISGRAIPVTITATAAVGRPLQVRATAPGLPACECTSQDPLPAAIQHPLSSETLAQQLGRLGGSGFVLADLTAHIEGQPMVPHSVLGQLRRQLVADLQAVRRQAESVRPVLPAGPILPALRARIARSSAQAAAAQLLVLCRSLAQVRAAVDQGVRELYVDLQDPRAYREAVSVARAAECRVLLATPRVAKPGEMGLFRSLARCEPDGMLVRNLAGLDFFTHRGTPCVCDYSLNTANELTVDYLHRLGAERITASYDLNREQMIELAGHAPVELLEVVVHQHMPMFHMEHCVFCAVLSPGTNKTNCGRPCDTHQVLLRDRVGSLHPLTADIGCRNTLYNGTPQSGAEVVAPLVRLGVRRFRIEFLPDEPPATLQRCLDLYRDLLAGRTTGHDVWTALQAHNRTGVTRGTHEQRRDPLALL